MQAKLPTRSIVSLALMAGIALASWAHAEDRAAVPDAQAYDTAVRQVDEAFKIESTIKDPAKELELAHQLVEAARSGKDTDAVRYAELCRARDLACAADLQTAFDITEVLIKSFVMDPWVARADVLSDVSARPTVSAVESVITWSAEAVSEQKLDQGRRLADAASSLAVKLNSALVLSDLRDLYKQLAARERDSRIIEGLKARLRSKPDDREVGAELAKLLCAEDKWDEALPLLRETKDVRLAASVKLDLQNPSTTDSILKVGDVWWNLAELDKAFPSALSRHRAMFWYRQIDGELEGLAKVRVDGRLANSDRQDEPSVTVGPGTWTALTFGGARWDPAPTLLKLERDFVAVRLSNSGKGKVYFVNNRIITEDFAVGMTVKGPCLLGFLSADRRDHSVFCTVPGDGKWHELQMQRQRQSFGASMDGHEIAVQNYGADARMAGVIGFVIEPAQQAEVRSFVLR